MKLAHHSVVYEPSQVFSSEISYINTEISLRLSRDKKCQQSTDTAELSNHLSNNHPFGPKITPFYAKDSIAISNSRDPQC
jgi:hypothetical protein